MNLVENKHVIQAFYNAGNRGDLESCLALLADDVTWTNIGSTKYSGTYVGKEALIANLLGPAFGRLKSGICSTLDNIVAEGDFVVVQSRGKAETTDGRPYNNTYCHVFRIRDGQISEVTEYFDTQLASAVFELA
jgi:ketosteroid isomerase-like protein